MDMHTLGYIDPELASAIDGELRRQDNTIELIASENIVPPVILEVQGSILTNKYAEGYPGHRYHGGCEYMDAVESLAIERAKRLFGAEHANVQPHSGVNANLAVFVAMLKPGDVILGMDLKQGGHLSHGSAVNVSGKYYQTFAYGLDPRTERIDYDQVRDLAMRHRPRLLIAGASAYPRVIDFARFREIADEVGSLLLVDMAHIAGLVAGGAHPSPVPYADFVTSTTTKTLRGARGGFILCRAEYAKAIDSAIFPGIQGGPIMQNVAAKALTFKLAATAEFRAYAAQIVRNAQAMAARFQERGLRLVTGGTDNHLMLLDLRDLADRGVTGHSAEQALAEVGIAVNKNLIPGDPQKPTVTSGVRIGAAAITSRGFKEDEAAAVADIIADILLTPSDATSERARRVVRDLCKKHAIYQS
ncbi:MAG: glycine hydroxymethyltransferase [Bacillota bacterium]|nr:glycine hydroxymethyltransferase [Bacillota bacterium]